MKDELAFQTPQVLIVGSPFQTPQENLDKIWYYWTACLDIRIVVVKSRNLCSLSTIQKKKNNHRVCK